MKEQSITPQSEILKSLEGVRVDKLENVFTPQPTDVVEKLANASIDRVFDLPTYKKRDKDFYRDGYVIGYNQAKSETLSQPTDDELWDELLYYVKHSNLDELKSKFKIIRR